MEVNRLLGEEITYELQIRGLPISGTVNEKRAALREVLRMERTGQRMPPETCNLDPNYELSICEGKLEDLSESIRNLDYGNRQNEYKRFNSRLFHLRGRMGRIRGDPELERYRDGLISRCEELYALLRRLDDQTASENQDRGPTEAQCPISSESVAQANISLLDMPVPLLPEILPYNRVANTNRELEHTDRETQRLSSQMENLTVEGGDRRTRVSRVASLRERFEAENSQFRPSSSRITREPGPAPSTLPREHSVQFCSSEVRRNDPGIDFSNRANTSMNLLSHLRTTHSSPLRNQENLEYYPSLRSQDDFYRLDIGRLRIQYDGISSVTSFLERIEELRKSRGISKERLLQSAPELFTKDALLWLRMGSFTSWDDLVNQLRDAFQPHDYEYSLWEEIRKRTQGVQERVVNYVSVMENFFKKLGGRPSEESRVQLIRRNMLPHIQSSLALHKVSTLSELIRLAKAIEETESRIQRFCPPPTTTKHLVEPELAYKRPPHAVSVIQTVETASATEVVPSSDVRKEPICWNCNGTGHRFRKCDKPKRIFCFKCGKDNVTSNSCLICKKNSTKTGQ